MTTKPTDPFDGLTTNEIRRWHDHGDAGQFATTLAAERRKNARLRHALTVAVHCMENFGCEPSAINIAKSALAGEVKVDK